ncbi:MAG: YlxR family protein [Acidimicrobiales bacterium]
MGCRRRAPRHELVRLVRSRDGFAVVGPSLEGRGAWLCPGSASCLAEATKRRAFARAFRAPTTADHLTVDDLVTAPIRAPGPIRSS